MDKNTVISRLGLLPHPEGGYFRRTYASSQLHVGADTVARAAMTSIYYLLTRDNPVGHWHRNTSDIVHYFHHGDPLRYWLICPAGNLSEVYLGHDLCNNQQLQLTVPGGYWKASELCSGEYGLISEAVCPGFNVDDMQIAEAAQLTALFPRHREIIRRLAYHPPQEGHTE